jgi:1,4-alpha-glucan branching enzyme
MTSVRPDGQIEFRFFRPRAQHVKLLGTFNEWEGDSMELSPEGDGWWSVIASLTPGEYRFRYWADGHWFTDFAANGVEPGRHEWVSILIVPQSRMLTAEQSCIDQPQSQPLYSFAEHDAYESQLKTAA